VQLRPFNSPEQRAELYAAPYKHQQWEQHVLRVAHTAEILREMRPASVADLSCGDGAVVAQAELACPAFLGDITPGWPFTGPIEETVSLIPEVDVFVCSETLEHVVDPDGLLQAIRAVAARLLLTTPEGETWPVRTEWGNPEHYWGWGLDDVETMLGNAGWTPETEPETYKPVPRPYYSYQIWRCV
jgi:hypothetical protein